MPWCSGYKHEQFTVPLYVHGCFIANCLELWQGQQWRNNLDSLVLQSTEAWHMRKRCMIIQPNRMFQQRHTPLSQGLKPRGMMTTFIFDLTSCFSFLRGKFLQCTWAEQPQRSGAEPWRWRENGARLLQFRSLLQRSWLFLLSEDVAVIVTGQI